MPYVGSPAQIAAQKRNIKFALAARHKPMSDADYVERIKSQCELAPSGCLEWRGYLHPEGYGETSCRGKGWRVHRLMYTLVKGAVPDHLMVCHTCDNRKCCNIEHLWLGTRGDNLRDMAAKGRHQEQVKTKCPRGHEYNDTNTYIVRKSNGKTARSCRQCQLIRCRIRGGWTREQAEKMPVTPHGHRPVNGSFPRKRGGSLNTPSQEQQ